MYKIIVGDRMLLKKYIIFFQLKILNEEKNKQIQVL